MKTLWALLFFFKCRRGTKLCDFRPISRCISESCYGLRNHRFHSPLSILQLSTIPKGPKSCRLSNHMVTDDLRWPLAGISAILKLSMCKNHKYTAYVAHSTILEPSALMSVLSRTMFYDLERPLKVIVATVTLFEIFQYIVSIRLNMWRKFLHYPWVT